MKTLFREDHNFLRHYPQCPSIPGTPGTLQEGGSSEDELCHKWQAGETKGLRDEEVNLTGRVVCIQQCHTTSKLLDKSFTKQSQQFSEEEPPRLLREMCRFMVLPGSSTAT